MKIKFIIPLLAWLIPTIITSIILFKVDAPLTKMQFSGFVTLLISACITYIVGIKLVLKEKS